MSRDTRDPQTVGMEILRLTRTAGYSATDAADAVLRGNPTYSPGTNGAAPGVESPADRHRENGAQGRNDALR